MSNDLPIYADIDDQRKGSVISMIDAWVPLGERAILSKKLSLEALRSLPRPFDRAADPTHVTASAAVLSSAGTLLHKHKHSGMWFGPGGHVDEGEWPWDAAQRETLEETGIPASHPYGGPKLLHADVHDTPHDDHVHLDLRFLLLAEPIQPAPPPHESQDVRWFLDSDAVEITDVSYRQVLEIAHCLRKAGKNG